MIFDYEAFFKRFLAACASQDRELRYCIKQEINWMLQRIPVEEAALQLVVYRLMHMQTDDCLIRLDIKRDLAGNTVMRYATRYKQSAIWTDPKKGGPAVVLEPLEPNCAVLVVCRGTLAMTGTDCIARPTWPSGIKDDLHHRGIGYMSHTWMATRFIELAKSVRNSGRELVLLGHSLGGTTAAGLFAAVPSKERDHISMLSFNAPGSSVSIADSLEGDAARIRCLEHRKDLVRFFGRKKLAGTQILVSDTAAVPLRVQAPHAVPQLTIWVLKGKQCEVEISQRSSSYNNILPEALRVTAGVLFGWALPA